MTLLLIQEAENGRVAVWQGERKEDVGKGAQRSDIYSESPPMVCTEKTFVVCVHAAMLVSSHENRLRPISQL